jgi:hypothetical protein
MGIIEENPNKKINDLARKMEEEEQTRVEEERQYNNPLNDPETDISQQELDLLDESDNTNSSDETQLENLLDKTDEDGTLLNETGTAGNKFDTGEDLDMPHDLINPDHDIDEESK